MRHTSRCLPEYRPERYSVSKHPTHVPAIKILALPWCPGHVARTVARRGMALTPYAFTSVAVQSGRSGAESFKPLASLPSVSH